MVKISVLRDCLNGIVNAEKRGKRQVVASAPPQRKPSGSRQGSPWLGAIAARSLGQQAAAVAVLAVRRRAGDLEIIDDHRAGKVVVDLIGRILCGVISPRFDVALGGIEQIASDLLPSRQFGHVVLTTPYGIMDQEEARRKHTGGKILGFFF
ncbi:unnamed protein product [Prorocentrum cordatum]|uniref:40S ribosomal protein S15a n=1 Tax=Prorocentrum cordatum TaxID=2364126 RepID=A0ABN9SUG7_9DINO|nr:unnamed protein product [Polarella glacialis]